MTIGSDVSKHKSLLTPLGGGQIRHFSTENSNSTEQSTKWDKLEGKLTSGFIHFDVLKSLEPLSKDILFPETIEGDLIFETIPFIYRFSHEMLQERFEQEWFHIPTKEKSDLFQAFINEFRRVWLLMVGPKGFVDYLS